MVVDEHALQVRLDQNPELPFEVDDIGGIGPPFGERAAEQAANQRVHPVRPERDRPLPAPAAKRPGDPAEGVTPSHNGAHRERG